MLRVKKVSIGGGQGFWGDSPDAAIHMIRHGNLNYMACDYLAELTLSIMQRQKMKNPAAGYARDFISLMKEIGKEAYEKKIGIITNAGGMNITGAVDALKAVAEEQEMHGYKIGYVTGDDLLDQIFQLLPGFERLFPPPDLSPCLYEYLVRTIYHDLCHPLIIHQLLQNIKTPERVK